MECAYGFTNLVNFLFGTEESYTEFQIRQTSPAKGKFDILLLVKMPNVFPMPQDLLLESKMSFTFLHVHKNITHTHNFRRKYGHIQDTASTES